MNAILDRTSASLAAAPPPNGPGFGPASSAADGEDHLTDLDPAPLSVPLLTAEGRILDLGPDARAVIAVYESGHVWVRLGAEMHPLTQAVIARATLRGKPARLRTPRPVSAAALKSAYAAATRLSAAPVDLAQTQIRIADYVRQTYEAGANDLIIEHSVNEASARIKILNSVMPLPWAITKEDAEAIHRATHGLATAVGAGFNPTANQSVSVFTADHPDLPWPEGLESLRVTFIHTAYGMAMRVRYPRHEIADHTFRQLGLHPDQERLVLDVVRRPSGGIWGIGDVGTGKSRLLKAILKEIYAHSGQSLDITTMENPVEERIPWADQVQIVEGRTLQETAEAYEIQYRDVLRAGPNVLFGGEVRDRGSVMLAGETVRTGIRLLTTTHGDTIWDAHPRLARMGMDEDALYSSKVFSAMIGQRLLGRLCRKCSIPLLNSDEARRSGLVDRVHTLLSTPDLRGFWPWPDGALARMRVASPSGCDHCRIEIPSLAAGLQIPRRIIGTHGRIAALEVALPDAALMSVFRQHGAAAARDAWLDSGGHTTVAHACHHMANGIVSPEEVERVIRPLDNIAALRGLEPLAC